MGREIKPWDQLHIFTEQLYREYKLLSHGVDLIITDSPLDMYEIYAEAHNTPCWKNIFDITNQFNQEFYPLNFFIKRGNKKYLQHGRYQNEEEARKIDKEILRHNVGLNLIHIQFNHESQIIETIISEIS